jgi:hypothetical protein
VNEGPKDECHESFGESIPLFTSSGSLFERTALCSRARSARSHGQRDRRSRWTRKNTEKIDGGGVTFRANKFLVAIGLNNRNGTDGGSRDPSGDPVVDTKNNWWGSADGPEAAEFNQDGDDDDRSDVVGAVDFEPFQRNPPGGRPNSGNGRRGPPN